MSFQDTASKLSPDIISRMREAVALGRWPDGKALNDEQRQTTLEAVMAWEAVHLPPEDRIGYLPTRDCAPTGNRPDEHVAPIRMVDNDD